MICSQMKSERDLIPPLKTGQLSLPQDNPEAIETALITFSLSLEKELPFEVQFKDNEQDAKRFLDQDKIKKQILHSYGYAASAANKKNVRLHITNFYQKEGVPVAIPIYSQANYAYLVTHMIGQCMERIVVWAEVLGQLSWKGERKGDVQFDSDGSVESTWNEDIRLAFEMNRPKFHKYKSEDIVSCAFCLKSSTDKEARKRMGAFYGPYLKNKFVHLLCALWASDVFLDKQSRLQGVDKALGRLQKDKCGICKREGMSFKCHSKCKKLAHYECAMEEKWVFFWVKYKVYCPSCATKLPAMRPAQAQ